MNTRIITIFFIMTILFASCKKDEFGYLSQNHPAVMVTVGNVWGVYNGVPAVQTSLSGGGAITIKLDIPASSGRTIKEITRVALHTTPNAGYATVRASSGFYNTAPIAGSGTSVTFTTSIAEFTSKTGISVTASGTATSFLSRYFYFLITLDNGAQVIPVPVRVYVNT
jgi:hypothetical protein